LARRSVIVAWYVTWRLYEVFTKILLHHTRDWKIFMSVYETNLDPSICGNLPEHPQDHEHERKPNVAEAANSWFRKKFSTPG